MKVLNRFRSKKTNNSDQEQQDKPSLSIIEKAKSFSVSIGDKVFFKHSTREPFITLYRGCFYPTQKGKRIAIENKEKKTIKLVEYKLQRLNNEYIFIFSAKGYAVQLHLKVTNEGLTLSISSEADWDKIKLSFARLDNEELLGFGNTKSKNLINLTINSYPIEEKGGLGSHLANKLLNKDKILTMFSTSDVLLSSENYLLIVNELFFQATFHKDSYSLTFPTSPKKIDFILAYSFNDLYFNLNAIRPNKQAIPARAQEGITITENIKNFEKTANLLHNNKIPATVTLISDQHWTASDLGPLESKAKRWGQRLLLRVNPYIAEDNTEFANFKKENLLLRDNCNEVLFFKLNGKNHAFINLIDPIAIKYIKQKLSKALKFSRTLGFLAECPVLPPINAISPNEKTDNLRTIWLKLFHKAISEALTEKKEGLLLISGNHRHSAEYGIGLNESMNAPNATQWTYNATASLLSQSVSGHGLTLIPIGDINKNSVTSETLFKEQIKIASLQPIMLFGADSIKMLIKTQDYLKKVLAKRTLISPFINSQLDKVSDGIPPVLPYWACPELENNFLYQDDNAEILCFGEHIQLLSSPTHNIINYRENGEWQRLLI